MACSGASGAFQKSCVGGQHPSPTVMRCSLILKTPLVAQLQVLEVANIEPTGVGIQERAADRRDDK